MNWPKITIVTTCFNDAAYVEETLTSIHDQHYPNLEHIVVDGGSTDGSVDIIRRYESKLAWWCSEKDKGHGDALAKGFAHSTGDIQTWICSDDVLLPGSLHHVAQYFVENPTCRWLCGSGLLIDGQGNVIEHVFSTTFSMHSMLYWQFWGAVQPAMFYSKKALEKAGGVDGSYNLSPDLDVSLRIARDGASNTTPVFLGALRCYADTQTVRHAGKMSEVNYALRVREGYFSVPHFFRTLIYTYYQQKFLAAQRSQKFFMRLGFGASIAFKKGTHWNVHTDETPN